MRGIKSTKTLDEKRQLCAGNKVILKKPLYYEYEEFSNKTKKFKQINELKKYKSQRGKVNMTKF